MTDDTMGTYIRNRRLELGLTQADLSALSGVTQAAISDLERGRVSLSSADVRRRLAAALRVRHIDLLIAAGELLPEEVAGLAVAPVSFPENSPAAKTLDILRHLPDEQAEWVLATARFAERKARGERDEDEEVAIAIRVGGNRRAG